MFSIPRINVIESDTGFSVEVLGRAGIRYAEDGKSMFIDSEVLAGPSGMAIYPDSITKWDEPYAALPVSAEDRQRILANLQDAFRFRGFEIQIL